MEETLSFKTIYIFSRNYVYSLFTIMVLRILCFSTSHKIMFQLWFILEEIIKLTFKGYFLKSYVYVVTFESTFHKTYSLFFRKSIIFR